MQINNIITTNFKANFYTVKKTYNDTVFAKISTDNEENLGREPILQYEYEACDLSKYKMEEPMTYDGKYFTSYCSPSILNYRIYYKDTGKYEKNGEIQKINPLAITKIVQKEFNRVNNLSPEQAISKGVAEGLVVTDRSDIPQDIPVILVLDEVKAEREIVETPENVTGVIVSSADMGILGHIENFTRNRISSMSIIWDDNKYNDLKKLAGKYLSIDNTDGILKYKEVNPVELKPEIIETVDIPKLENTERLLNFDELTPQNCGNKGYRLKVMQELVKEGKLKDITIPNGFVIPEGWINKFTEYIDVDDEKYRNDLIYDGIYAQEIEKKVKELKLNIKNLIARSNFNTEDLGSFSSAGIYDSKPVFSDWILTIALDIIDSKNSKLAQDVHKRYGIKDSQIQPSVIVQELIPAHFVFTMYSDNGDGNILIELSDISASINDMPGALIKFNKKTKEFTLERKQPINAEYLINEKGNILNSNYSTDKVTENWDSLLPTLGIIAEGALVLEKFFKHPQDIEGGIRKDKVFFWQTRDIVAKAVKKI